MRKKNLKPIIMSSLCAIALGSASVGSTFALFTDKAETTISVTSGVVDVKNELTLVSYTSSVDGTTKTFGEEEKDYTNDKVGSSFKLDNGNVVINKMVPGDKLTIRLTSTNKSNVKTKTRYVLSHATTTGKKDLMPALTITFDAGNQMSQADLFKWKEHDAASSSTGDTLYSLTATIEFVNHDDGIVANTEGRDNQYQDAACSIGLALESVQANAATSLIDDINNYLSAQEIMEGKNATMHDAMVDVDELNGSLTTKVYTLDLVKTDYAWGVNEDQFVAKTAITANKYNYFAVYDEMPTAQDYSIYANSEAWNDVNISNLAVGFDAGDATSISNVSYIRDVEAESHSIVLRTNGGDVVVNAPYDSVYLYGVQDALNVIAAANHSVYLYGRTDFVQVTKGRIVLTDDAEVKRIHLNTKAEQLSVDKTKVDTRSTEEFDDIIIDIAGVSDATTLPEFTRDRVTIAEEGTKVCTVATQEANNDLMLFQNGIYEQIKVQNEESEATWVNTSNADDETKSVAFQIANEYTAGTAVVDEETREIVVPEGKTIDEIVSESGIDEKISKAEVVSSTLPMAYKEVVTLDEEHRIDCGTPRQFGGEHTEDLPDRVYLTEYFVFKAFESKEELTILGKVLNLLGITDDSQIANVTPEAAINVIEQSNELTQAEKVYAKAMLTTRMAYLNWRVDFEVKFIDDIQDNSVCLAGNYQNYGNWLSFGVPVTVNHKEEDCQDTFMLMHYAYEKYPVDVFKMNYFQICAYVQEFKCGIVNTLSDKTVNEGKRVEVSLVIYDETDGTEAWKTDPTKRIVIDTIPYVL